MRRSRSAAEEREFFIRLALVAAAGGLWLAAFPPVGLAVASGFALVPLLELMRRVQETWRLAGWSLVAGLVFSIPALGWLRFITRHFFYAGWGLLALYLALYFVAFAVGGRAVRRLTRAPAWVVYPVVWTGLEYLRALVLGGFPWFFVGHAAINVPDLVQIADLGGVYLVSALAVVVNVAVHEASVALAHAPGRRKPAALVPARGAIATALVALVATAAYGQYRRATLALRAGPTLALIQANIPVDFEFEAGRTTLSREEDQKYVNAVFETHRRLSLAAVTQSPALIVWPESACVTALNLEHPSAVGWRRALAELADTAGAPLLVGAPAYYAENKRQRSNNSAYFFGAKASSGLIARYDKTHLVPFGEYNALQVYAPWLAPSLDSIVPFDNENLMPGPRRQPLFRLGEFSFRVLICYEDAMSYLARDAARDGADFLLAISNDGWFMDTPELDQHLAASRFRAIETRLPLARAANTGISSIVDPLGRVTHELTVAGHRRDVQGVLVGNLSLAPGQPPTLYVRLGDWWGGTCAAVSLTLMAVAVLKNLMAGRRVAPSAGFG